MVRFKFQFRSGQTQMLDVHNTIDFARKLVASMKGGAGSGLLTFDSAVVNMHYVEFFQVYEIEEPKMEIK